MDFHLKINEILKNYKNGNYQKSSTFMNRLINQSKISNFRSVRLNFYFSHLRIILRFASKPEVEFDNFVDQLIVIKNHYRNNYPKAREEDFYSINYNISILKVNIGCFRDAELVLNESLGKNKAENFAKNPILFKLTYLLLDIYIITKNIDKTQQLISLLLEWLNLLGKDMPYLESTRKNRFTAKQPPSPHVPNHFANFFHRIGSEKQTNIFWCYFYLSCHSYLSHKSSLGSGQLEICKFIYKEKFSSSSFKHRALALLQSLTHEETNPLKALELLNSSFLDLNDNKRLCVDFSSNTARLLHRSGQQEVSKKILSDLIIGYCARSSKSSASRKTALKGAIKPQPADNKENMKIRKDSISLIAYNLGVSLLETDPKKAFQFMCKAVSLYYNQPFFWCRLGQACVQFHKSALAPKSTPSFNSEDQAELYSSPLAQRSAVFKCCADCFKLHEIAPNSSLKGSSSKKKPFSCKVCCSIFDNKFEMQNNSYGLSLRDGLIYLQRASILLSRSRRVENDSLKRKIYINMAAVCYFMRDYYGAIRNCKVALSLKSSDGFENFVATLYCSESLYRIGSINEALKWLDPKKVKALCKDKPQLRAIALANLAVLYDVKGNKEKSFICREKGRSICPDLEACFSQES